MLASTAAWTSPISGTTYKYRRLARADMMDIPESFPIFHRAIALALGEIAETSEDPFKKEVAKRNAERHADKWAKLLERDAEVEAALIQRGVYSPKILPDPPDFDATPPDGSVWYFQVPEVDRTQLVGKLIDLASGMDLAEREDAAERVASFRKESDGSSDSEGGATVGDTTEHDPGSGEPVGTAGN